MSKKKQKFNGKCPKCNGNEFEMFAEIRASAKYAITIVGNEIVSADYNGLSEIDPDDIEEGSEYVQCSKCYYDIPMDEIELLY